MSILLTLKVLQVLFMFYQYSKLPQGWIGGSIKKMKKVKEDVFKWKDTRLKEIEVGDIVRLGSEEVCPFDVLILDTSELRYNDPILSVNESKIRGDGSLIVKRSIRNLLLRNSQPLKQGEYLTQLSKRLNGYIEYDSSSGIRSGFKGLFKLKNDPKMMQIRDEHVLYCGSTVYSKEVVGMVMFTGTFSRIFQQAGFGDLRLQGSKIKRTVTGQMVNKISLFMLIVGFVTSVILYILVQQSVKINLYTSTFESSVSLRKWAELWDALLNLIPGTLMGIQDGYCLIMGVYIMFKGVPRTMQIGKDGKYCRSEEIRKSNRPKLREIKRGKSGTFHKSPSHTQMEASEEVLVPNRQIELINISPRRGPEGSNSSKKPENILSRAASSEIKHPHKKEQFPPYSIRAINSSVLPDLGFIDQVFLDKTDTLTSGKMKVAEITTYEKCYEIPAKDFIPMINECASEPDKFAYEDENAVNKESGDYSEKSQE